MDRSSGLSKKCCYRATIDEDQGDRISSLHDSILSHILSLLPTKDAIRTSVLSREWEYKWTSIYNISFDDRLCNSNWRNYKAKREIFMSFVERVLLLCKNTVFEELQLFCRWNYDHSRAKAWMLAMLRCPVKKVDIRYDRPLNFPKCFFICDSVTELKLQVRDVRLLDNSLHSNLKILTLSSVHIQSHGLHRTGNLFTFPVLEKLHFHRCYWSHVKSIKIDAPMLASFEITDCVHENGSTEFEVEICADKLTKFLCRGGSCLEKFVLSSLSTVVEASLTYLFMREDLLQKNVFRACTLLQGFAAIVRCLELSGSVIQAAYVERSGPLPIFHKLTDLQVYSCRRGNEFNEALIDLLKRAPALELLTFTGCTYGPDADDLEEIELMPPTFLSHLKVVKYEQFMGNAADFKFMKFLLQSALVLEELLINSKYLDNRRARFENELLMSPKGSSHDVSIIFF